MSGQEFELTVSPVKASRIRKPRGCKVVDNLRFLAWVDEVMLRLLKLAELEDSMIAWCDLDANHLVVNLAVDVVVSGDNGQPDKNNPVVGATGLEGNGFSE